MTPKTERFEMRLDPETVERVDRWRNDQSDSPSRAEAIRRLVEAGLPASSTNEFRPTSSEKLMMWMLAELMKQHKDYDKKSIDLIEEAIFGGHFWALEWEMVGIFHNHVDRKEAVGLVVDTLDMWDFIEGASDRFGPPEERRLESEVGSWATKPQFPGFDGNNESEYMSIARFLVEKMGRFARFKGRSFNSHSRKVTTYRSMIDRFETMRAGLVGRGLSVDEVIDLLKR